jgi:N-terminal domain with HPIH motif
MIAKSSPTTPAERFEEFRGKRLWSPRLSYVGVHTHIVTPVLSTMIGPLVAITSRSALYPIQSIVLIALIVSGAYFHLLDIARNPPAAVSDGDLYSSNVAFSLPDSTIWARRSDVGWKWSIEARPEIRHDVLILSLYRLTVIRKNIYILLGDK